MKFLLAVAGEVLTIYLFWMVLTNLGTSLLIVLGLIAVPVVYVLGFKLIAALKPTKAPIGLVYWKEIN